MIFDLSHGKKVHTYHTRAIISRGLYILFSIFHCCLYRRAVSVTNNLCTKQGNSSIFEPKIRGLYSRAFSNQEQVIMARIRYIQLFHIL